MASERIQKIIAASGLMSRRAAETAISLGRVSINGEVVTEMGRLADLVQDKILVDGNVLPTLTVKKTFLFYKPRGIVTTKFDPDGKPTVMNFFKDEPGLNPVGRLDFDSEGLLLMTHDGDLLLKLTHPRFEVQKVYEVEVSGRGKPDYLNQFLSGIELSDGIGHFDECEVIEEDRAFRVTVSEGRNRFVRRMFGELGLTVNRLKRIRMGEYLLGELKPGERKLLP